MGPRRSEVVGAVLLVVGLVVLLAIVFVAAWQGA